MPREKRERLEELSTSDLRRRHCLSREDAWTHMSEEEPGQQTPYAEHEWLDLGSVAQQREAGGSARAD